MSRPKEPTGPVQRILHLLHKVEVRGVGWTALCPAHHDRANSLSLTQGDDGRILLKCHAGCDVNDIVEALGLDMSDLFVSTRKHRKKSSKSGGLTLDEYSEAKRLPVKFLRKLGVEDLHRSGTTAVRIPYLNEQGQVVAVRFRHSLHKEPRFTWRAGDKVCLYGLSRLQRARSKGYICVVEGESDAQSLWLHHFPAIALPGAATWRDDWVEHFQSIDKIYVMVEPDRGGEAVLKWLRSSKIRDRVRLISLDGVKDPSALYLAHPKKFPRAWKKAMHRAIPWNDLEKQENCAKRKAAWAKCKHLARQPKILSLFVEALKKRGVAGETRAAKLLYLALTSRVLDRPVSVVMTGPSSGGKSFLTESTLQFFPSSAFYDLTAMSEKALAYSTEPICHRFLVLYEGAALNSDFLNYLIRSLLSEGWVKYEYVEKTPEGLQSRLIEREGPTGLIMTTTAVTVHPENDTRQIAIPVSDSRSQTRRVLLALAKSTNEDGDQAEPSTELEPWYALQEWIGFANQRVAIPYAKALAELVPPVACRLRRDFKAILNLIKSHAILHQATRDNDKKGRIIADFVDYRRVRRLINGLVSEGVERTVSQTVRETVKAVKRICSNNSNSEHASGEKDDPNAATILQVAKRLRLDRSSASRRVKQALTRGHLKNVEEKRGRPHRLVIGDPLPGEARVMPTYKELEEKWKQLR